MFKYIFQINLILLILSLSDLTFSQVKVHKHLTAEDGLANNYVHRIMYDRDGYMWFGTFNGVSRWDGKNFMNITKKNGLISSPVIDLVQADDGTIYFSNYTKGIVSYKNGVLDTIDNKDGLASNMVIRLRIYNGNPVFFSQKAQLFKNGKLTDINDKFPQIKSRISDFLEDENGMYAACRDANDYAGFYVKDNYGEFHFTQKHGLISSQVDLFEKTKNGEIIIATSKGPNKYSKGKIYPIWYQGKIVKGVTNDVHAGSDGTNYYGGDYGVIVEQNGKTELLTIENGLLENIVISINEDKNGTVYFGHENSGVSIYYPGRFENYLSNAKSKEYYANAIIQSGTGNILLGTPNGISVIRQAGNIQKDAFLESALKDNFILSMKKENNGRLVFGTKRGFIIVKNGKVFEYNLKRKTFYQDINSIEFSPDGDILLAERRRGLLIFTGNGQAKKDFLNSFLTPGGKLKGKLLPNQKYISNIENIKIENVKNGRLTYITYKNGLLSNRIMDMHLTSDSSLIIGFHGRGVSIYKNGVFTNITAANGLTDQLVNTVYETSDGSYWFGTSTGGICIFKNNEIVDTINVNNGLSSNDIRGITQVGGKVYVTTSNGLNVILRYGDSYFVRQIKESDGLPSNVCNLNTLFVDNANNIWIGTNKGVTKYNPRKDKIISTPPKIYLSGLQLFNEDYPIDKFKRKPELNYDQNYIKFIFTAVNLSAPENVLYKYKLSGVDKDWVTSNNDNVQYTSLDDGEYTFEVKARNEWGYWSEPASLSFVIFPAWWETWWFYTLTVVAIGSLIAFVSSYRYRHLLAIEKMRTKISADLHDSVGSGLSEISILSELLKAQASEDRKDFKSGLNNISTISRSLIESMSDIVWLVNPKKDTLKDLFKRLQMSYQEVLRYSDADLVVENLDELENIRLPMNFRQHLYLIFKEAINNAIKYSGGDLFTLKIQTSGNNLTVIFSDNGKGFDLNHEKMGNGLMNMKNRAKEIGGKIEYFSVENKGTTIKFTGKFSKQKL